MSFRTTEWTMVLTASCGEGSIAQRAFSRLCEIYWEPLYAFLKKSGYDPDNAADLVQGFFARMVESNGLKHVNRTSGRFRSYLLKALKHYVGHERDRAMAIKRGGGELPISFVEILAEPAGILEPLDERTPEHVFARRWATALIERSYERLRQEWQRAGKGGLFEELEDYLKDEQQTTIRDLARRLETKEGALRVTLYRLRRRFAQLLRSEVAATVARPDDVESELLYLLTCFRQR